jgi:hypothetical protein
MSKIANDVYKVLTDMFPARLGARVTKEIYINYKGQKLFFDFFIRELNLYVEVQGEQHGQFNKHFYDDKDAFIQQKSRDNLKVRYVQENPPMCLIRIKFDEEITEENIRSKLLKVLDGECFYD